MSVARITAVTLALVAGALASPIQAQIIRGAIGRQPVAFTSLSLGWTQTGRLCDARSNACWDFNGAPQWRASLEVPVGRGAAFGVAGTRARAGLLYQGAPLSGCGSCDANANISQLLATFRIGGGGELGFHQLIDLSAGATLFSNFRSTSGARLSSGTTTDVSFSLGYGFGYGISQSVELMVAEDYGLIIHSHSMSGTSNSIQQSTLRAGVRLSLGEKSAL
jgi:hypothetical protein